MRRRPIILVAVLGLLCASLSPMAAPAASAAATSASTAVVEAPQGAAASQAEVSAVISQAESQAALKNPKADSQVAAVVASVGSSGPAAALSVARTNSLAVSGDSVLVIVEASDLARAETSVTASGAKIEGSAGNLVQILATPTELAGLLSAPGVDYVRAPLPHVADAVPVTDEAVTSTNAGGLQAVGDNGAGVKIAVIDVGFAGLAAAQGTGDLPTVTGPINDCEGNVKGTNHGTAVAEIVHKMAPAAQLYLYCIGTEVDLATAEGQVKAAGIKIVNHSVSWFNDGRGDGTSPAGMPDATVKDANTHGILWVNSAGDYAQQHWSGTFQNNGSGDNLFATGDIGNDFTVPLGDHVCAYLKWDNWPASSQDYDLFLVQKSSGAIFGQSTNTQNGSQAPIESACMINTNTTNDAIHTTSPAPTPIRPCNIRSRPEA
jgi:hypothetical protein